MRAWGSMQKMSDVKIRQMHLIENGGIQGVLDKVSHSGAILKLVLQC